VTANSNTLEDGTGLASNYSLATGQTVASAITTKALTATIAAAINQIYHDMFSQIFRNRTRTTFLQAYKFSNP
jgi:hypothetical protein